MILIISHRRSGTHLLIDTIRANFDKIDDYYISIKELIVNHGENALPELKNIINNSEKERIVKCHFQLGSLSSSHQEILNYLMNRRNLKIIYLKRNYGDVMLSMSKCDKLTISNADELSSYCNSPSSNIYEKHVSKRQHYENHITSWSYSLLPLQTISFENLITDYYTALKEIEQLLKIKRNKKVIDVRHHHDQNFRFTSVEYNGGKINNPIWHNEKETKTKFSNYNLNSESQDRIQCSGIIPLWKSNDKWKTIIIYNSLTNTWDLPKGIVENNENYLIAAIRESEEELGLDFSSKLKSFYSIKKYNYVLPNESIKETTFFTVFSKIDTATIKLSVEHSKFKEIEIEKVHHFFEHYEKIELFRDIENDLNLLQETLRHSKNLVSKIKEQVKNYKYEHPTCELIVAGSLYTNDFNKDHSDIDLILLHDDNSRYNIHFDKILKQLQLSGIKRSLGITSVTKNEQMNLSNPLFQCFDKDSISNTKFKNEGVNISYELFRIVWYRALRGYMGNYADYKYDCCKGIILLEVLINREGKFTGYSNLKADLLSEMYNLDGIVEEKKLLIDCINFKKGIVSSLDANSIQEFFNVSKAKLSDIRNTKNFEYIITKFIIDLHLNPKIKIGKNLEVICKKILGNEICDLLEKMLILNYTNLMWIILIELRVAIWHIEVKSSIHKYSKYRDQLFEKHKLTHGETDYYKSLIGLIQEKSTMPNNVYKKCVQSLTI